MVWIKDSEGDDDHANTIRLINMAVLYMKNYSSRP